MVTPGQDVMCVSLQAGSRSCKGHIINAGEGMIVGEAEAGDFSYGIPIESRCLGMLYLHN